MLLAFTTQVFQRLPVGRLNVWPRGRTAGGAFLQRFAFVRLQDVVGTERVTSQPPATRSKVTAIVSVLQGQNGGRSSLQPTAMNILDLQLDYPWPPHDDAITAVRHDRRSLTGDVGRDFSVEALGL